MYVEHKSKLKTAHHADS